MSARSMNNESPGSPDSPERHVIARLGHHGDGIAEGPVFVARTLPGEVVGGAVIDGRIAAARILTPSPDRISPACPHYRACGGCALQHAREAFVTEWKTDVIVKALAAHGLEAPMRRPHISPLFSRRRATFSGRRLKKGAVVGFHARASDVLTAVPNCLILHPDLRASLPMLEDLVGWAGTRKGTLSLSLTRSETGLDLQVTGATPALDGPMLARLGQWAGQQGLARLTWQEDVIALARAPVQRMGRALVTPPPGAFLQATDDAQQAMQQAVIQSTDGAARIADLFAGCGTFALPLAETAAVHAVEGDGAMLSALDAAWRHTQGLKPVTTESRDLFRRPLTPQELARFDAVVIDPPRAGAEAQARALADSRVPRIAALSCNPVTFARDARILVQAGYRLNWVQLIDQFRFSPHVELAAEFSR